MTIKQAFEKFIFAKRIQGLSDESISDYDTIVGLFVRYVGYDTDIEDITPDMIDSYMEYQLGRGIARSTFATYVRNAKIFLMWIETKYNLDLNASEIVTPRTPKTMPYIYSTEDIRLIFATIHFDEEWLVFRNRSMVALMLDSGLRQAEICNLKISDMDFHGDIVKVHGKGNKERLVPLGGHSKRYILTYLELCPYESNKLFLSVHGDSITTNALKLMATKLAKRLLSSSVVTSSVITSLQTTVSTSMISRGRLMYIR